MAWRSAAFFLLCSCALLASAVDGIASNCSCDRAALPSIDSLRLPPPLAEGDGITELQCSLGCSEVSTGTRENSINVRECKSSCTDAFSKALNADDCIGACDSPSCISGCNVYAQLSSTAEETDSVAGIVAPSSAPVLALQESGRPAEYSVEVPDLVTRSSVGTSLGLLFRIDNPTHNTTTYIPVVATVGNMTLFLWPFLCLRISVSYAILSRRSLSEYSPPTTLCVSGVPGPPRNIDILVQEDIRPGYSKNAVLNISWGRPENFEYLSHFSLGISSIDPTSTVNLKCRLNQHLSIINIDKNSTGVLIQSQDIGQLPVLCCRYQITLISHPSIRESGIAAQVFKASYTFKIHCEASYDTQSGKYTLRADWHLDIPAAVIQAISHYEVEVSMGFLSYSIPSPVQRICHGNFCAASGLSPSESNYFLRVTPINNLPRSQCIGSDMCTLSAPPFPPSKMDSIFVGRQDFNIDDKLLDVTVRWIQPEYFNGRLLGYELRVAKEPTYDNDDGSYTATNLAYVLNNIEPTSTSFRVRVVILWYEPEAAKNTIHFQMRARNEFQFSNWSEPVQIQLPTVAANSKVHIYIISGLVMMSSIALALILIFVLTFVFWKCKRRRRRITVRSVGLKRTSNIYHCVEPSVVALQFHTVSQQVVETDSWEMKPATVNIFTDQQLHGYFGKTYKGSVESENGLQHEVLSVAVKKLEDHATVEDKKDFLNEIDIMKQVSGSSDVRKTFVVNMVGCITIQEPLLLILEYTHQSDLLSYVRDNRRQEQAACSTNKEGSLSRPRTPVVFEVGEMERRDLWRFAWQIAAGMVNTADFLSSLAIVHGNLACRNILVGEGKNIKVSNFVMPTQSGKNVIDSKSLRWMALESMLHNKFTTSSDVWSYGIVLWELSTMGAFPYPTVSDEKLAPLLKTKFRLEKPEHSTPAMYELMEQCWNEDPQSRPSFSELCKNFEHMLGSCIENEQLHVSTAEFVTG